MHGAWIHTFCMHPSPHIEKVILWLGLLYSRPWFKTDKDETLTKPTDRISWRMCLALTTFCTICFMYAQLFWATVSDAVIWQTVISKGGDQVNSVDVSVKQVELKQEMPGVLLGTSASRYFETTHFVESLALLMNISSMWMWKFLTTQGSWARSFPQNKTYN